MRFATLLAFALASALSVGCADGDGATDAGPADAGPGAARDAGSLQCPVGQHVCGGGCVDDLENLPDNGCRNGCGEPCEVAPGESATCDDAGECAVGCEPPAMLVDGECVCTPMTCADLGASCGAPDDGCGTPLDCGRCDNGAECMMGTCGCVPDDAEPNDRRSLVMTDTAAIPNEDWSMTYESWNLDSAEDEDWYVFSLEDPGWDIGAVRIRVDLTELPPGSNYDVAAYYVCAGGGHDISCTSGAPDNTVGGGCLASASGATPDTAGLDINCSGTTSESGTAYIRVFSDEWSGVCSSYRLSLTVEN